MTTKLTNFLSYADIGPLGASVSYITRLADACGVRADRRDILQAARELDWRIANVGSDSVILPPATKPMRLSTSYEGE